MGRDLARAVSLASLCFIYPWVALFLNPANRYYMATPPGLLDLLGMVLNVLWLGALLFSLARLYRRCGESPWLTRAAAVLLLVLLGFAAGQFHRSVESPIPLAAMSPLLRRVLKFALLGVGALLAAGGLWLFLRRPALLLRVAANVPLVLFPYFLLVLAQAGWVVLKPDPAVAQANRVRPAARTGPRHRTVLLLFDELDYGIAFDRRPTGFELPEFDRLRSEAWWAEQAFPPAGDTLESIPALLSGRRLETPVKAGTSELRLHFRDGETASFRETPTLFTDAYEQGERTALAGWYHPYPRVVGQDVDDCSWQTFYYWHARADRSLPELMLHQIALAQLLGTGLGPALFGEHHIQSYQRLVAEAKRLAADPSLDLVYVHFSVPHLPGIYDRAGKHLTVRRVWDLEAYLGNLVLCDQALGEVRRAMILAGLWERSTVIVTSDHWLRQKGLPPGAEYRVPYAVKLPGRPPGARFKGRLNTVLTRDLLREQAAGRLPSPIALEHWVESRRKAADQR